MLILRSPFVLSGDNVASIPGQTMGECKQLFGGKLGSIILPNPFLFAPELPCPTQLVVGRYYRVGERRLFTH